ncbi:GIY-YIG nuclease family protein [uncultured Bacteroides sp.]|uniref:GIY-YIG nuclease family protein n=1 Tax=uncultured Bacteroides sp. TaxID=162156 RepID=UPI002614330C|nr:GIY-YIG nuclease family protein [uncultured Bacteroides sp.]
MERKSGSDFHVNLVDMEGKSADGIADYMNTIGLSEVLTGRDSNLDRGNLYCGITNDIERRMKEHTDNDFQIEGNRIFACKCDNTEIAKEVERLMSNKNYDTGRNPKAGGCDDSVYVYLFKKVINY